MKTKRDYVDLWWLWLWEIFNNCGIILESFCDHLGIILGPFWDYFGIIFGSFFNRFYFSVFFLYIFGIILWLFWDHFGSFLTVFFNMFCIIFGYFWDHFVIILGSFWNRFGIVFWQFLNIFIFCDSFGNGPGTILGYSLIVPGYIQPIPGLFSEIYFPPAPGAGIAIECWVHDIGYYYMWGSLIQGLPGLRN